MVVREIALTINSQITAGGEYASVVHDRRPRAEKVSRGRVGQHQMSVGAGAQRGGPDVVYQLSTLIAAGIGAVAHDLAPRQKNGVKRNDRPCHDRTEYSGHVCRGTTNGDGTT